eukprot:1176998-Prorocentrum_minimum.AAC.3
MISFYGSSCANNGKDALDTPEAHVYGVYFPPDAKGGLVAPLEEVRTRKEEGGSLREGGAHHPLHGHLHGEVVRWVDVRQIKAHHLILRARPVGAALHVHHAAHLDARGEPIRRGNRGHIRTTDPSDAGRTGIFSQWTNQTREARLYSHDGPIGTIECAAHLRAARRDVSRQRRAHLARTMDQSDAGSAGTFSRWTNQTQEARVCSTHLGRRRHVEGHAVHVGHRPAHLRGQVPSGPST